GASASYAARRGRARAAGDAAPHGVRRVVVGASGEGAGSAVPGRPPGGVAGRLRGLGAVATRVAARGGSGAAGGVLAEAIVWGAGADRVASGQTAAGGAELPRGECAV